MIEGSSSLKKDRQKAFEESLLRAAVIRGDIAKVEHLLSSGVDPSAADKGGIAPLHWAVWENDLELVEVLLKAGADPNARTKDMATPLWYAEDDFGLHEVAERLREYGADKK